MPGHLSIRLTIIVASLLLLAAPTQAGGCNDCDGGSAEGSEEGNQQADSRVRCHVVDYSLSKPTAIVVDPDRCFLPSIMGQTPT